MKADYMAWNDALKIVDLLKKEKKYDWLAYVGIGLFTGLRIGDILKLTYGDIKTKVTVVEEKTGKKRDITIDKEVISLIQTCQKELKRSDSDLIVPFTSQYCSRQLKYFAGRAGIWNIAISNHSLRKTFSRQIWVSQGCTESSLVLLSDILNHSSIAITRKYLGIRDEEKSAAYLSLSLKPTKTVK